MFRFCEACNGSSFDFLAILIRNLLVKTAFASYYLKLRLPMFLRYFLILSNFSLMFLIRKQRVVYISSADTTEIKEVSYASSN